MLLSVVSHLHSLRPLLPTVALAGVAPTIFIAHTSWRIVSLFLPRRLFYVVEDAIWGWYQKYVVFVYETCIGVEVVLEGIIPKKVENALFICNHQTTMDWVVADMLAIRQGMVGHMRYVFKDSLKYFPLYGYVWGVHGGIFVRRDGAYNALKMQKTLKMLVDRKVPLYLVIFPEGTRYHPGKESLLAKSQAYAFQNHLKPLSQVLTPRIKAFHCAVSTLEDYLDAVYDATIIYETDQPQKHIAGGNVRQPAPSMWDVLAGRCKRVIIKFDRIESKDIPVIYGMESPTFKWLHMRFQLKDEFLEGYYSRLGQGNKCGSEATFGVPISKANTILPSLSLVALTATMLFCPVGRSIYACTILGGTVFGIAYAHICF